MFRTLGCREVSIGCLHRPPQQAFFLMVTLGTLLGAVLAWKILNKAEGAGRKSSVLERLPGYRMLWAARSPPLEAEGEPGEPGAGEQEPGAGAEGRSTQRRRSCPPLPQLPTGQARTSGQAALVGGLAPPLPCCRI